MFSAMQMKSIVLALLVSGIFVAQGLFSQPSRDAANIAAAGDDNAVRVVEEVEGKVKKVDLEQGIITLVLGNDNDPGVEKQFSLSGRDIPAKGESGEKLSLAQIKPGLAVRLSISDMDDVVRIVVMSPRQKGTIKSVNLDQRTLTIYVGNHGKELKFQFAPVVRIEMENEPLVLRDLFPGMGATLFLSLDRQTVHRMVVSARMNGRRTYWALIKIDHAAHTVQLLTGGKGKFRMATYPVAEDFRFVFQKKMRRIKLEDLVGVKSLERVDRALPVWVALDEPQKTIIAIVATAPKVSGVVQKVDAKTRILTVQSSAGAESFAVHQDVIIYPKAQKLTLADIKPGTPLELHLGYNLTEVTTIVPQAKEKE